MNEVEIWDDDEMSVEELIKELRRLQEVIYKLDETNMPERTKGFIDGLRMGLKQAVEPPIAPGVQFLSLIVAAYERKYGYDPNYEAKSAEHVRQAKADYEEMKKQPDWEERQRKAATRPKRRWPDTITS